MYDIPSLSSGRFHVNCAEFHWYSKYVRRHKAMPFDDIEGYTETHADIMRCTDDKYAL